MEETVTNKKNNSKNSKFLSRDDSIRSFSIGRKNSTAKFNQIFNETHHFETEIEILSISKILFLCSLGMVDFQKENHFQKRKILTL